MTCNVFSMVNVPAEKLRKSNGVVVREKRILFQFVPTVASELYENRNCDILSLVMVCDHLH